MKSSIRVSTEDYTQACWRPPTEMILEGWPLIGRQAEPQRPKMSSGSLRIRRRQTLPAQDVAANPQSQ